MWWRAGLFSACECRHASLCLTPRRPCLSWCRLRLDEGNVVSVDLGDTPFEVARDLPPLHLLDISIGDTFVQRR